MLSFARLQQAYEQIDSVAHQQQEKSALLQTMHRVVHARHSRIQSILLVADDFQRDEEWLRFKYAAIDFIRARDDLLKLELSEQERSILAEQDHYAQLAGESLEQVSELAFHGQLDTAKQVLLDQTLPLQQHILARLNRLKKLQKQTSAQAFSTLEQAYQHTLYRMSLFGVGILLLCGVIAVLVIQRTLRSLQALEQAKQSAEAASLAKSQFMGGMSLEWHTPLQVILSHSEMLKDVLEEAQQPHLLPDVEKIHHAGGYLRHLATEVLNLSRLQTGDMPLHMTRFNLAQLCQQVIHVQRPELEKNANTFEVYCEDHLQEIVADKEKVRQILLNLLSNAARFTRQGHVYLSAQQVGDYVEISIKDSGIGIPHEQQSAVFAAFQQVHNRFSRDYQGLGLGLAISQGFAQMMQGDILLHSQSGEGSHFILRLPLTAKCSRKY